MPVTQADIDSLNRAIASGTRSVTIGGQTVIYNTTESLIKARNDLRTEMQADAIKRKGTRRSKQSLLFQSDKGF